MSDVVLRLAYDREQGEWMLTLDSGVQKFSFPVQARVPEREVLLDRETPAIELGLPSYIGIDFRVIRPLEALGWIRG